MTARIDWNKLNKICVREIKDSMTMHLVVKTLVVQRLLIKYANNRYWTRIYTEYPVGEGKICDVLFINEKTKEAYGYEIQKIITPKYLKETKEIYENWEMLNMRTGWVLIDLNMCPTDVNQLKEYIDRQIL